MLNIWGAWDTPGEASCNVAWLEQAWGDLGPMTDGAYVNFLENEGRTAGARRLPHPDPAAPGSDQGALRPDQLLPHQPEHPPPPGSGSWWADVS